MNKVLSVLLICFAVLAGMGTAYCDVLEDNLQQYIGSELPSANPMCNFQSTDRVPITMTPQETVTSKAGVDGTTIKLRVKNNIFYRGKLLVSRGTIATAKVEIVATQGMNGIPAMIIVDRFEIPGLDSAKMKSYFVKKGLNLTYLVLPIKWVLTPFPPTGSLANFVIGGPTKISPKTDVTIYYYPDWECQ